MFINVLIALGSKTTNKAMIKELGVTKEEYEAARDELIHMGWIKKYRCRGGGIEYVKDDLFEKLKEKE